MEYLVATYRTLGVSPEASPKHNNGDSKRTAYARGLRQIHDKMRELGQYPMGQPPRLPGRLHCRIRRRNINSWARPRTSRRPAQFTTPGGSWSPSRRPPRATGHRPAPGAPASARSGLILGVAGVAATARVDATFNGAVTAVARAILASPQHHHR
jgi:hypothetical protein